MKQYCVYVALNLGLSKDERGLKRSAKRVLNFYESFRLKLKSK